MDEFRYSMRFIKVISLDSFVFKMLYVCQFELLWYNVMVQSCNVFAGFHTRFLANVLK